MPDISFFEANASHGHIGWKGKAKCENCGRNINIPGGAYSNVMSGKIKASVFCRNRKCAESRIDNQ